MACHSYYLVTEPTDTPFLNGDLLQRWPDLRLNQYFNELLLIYQKLFERQAKSLSKRPAAARESYETVCRWISEPPDELPGSAARLNDRRMPERAVVRSLVAGLKEDYGESWLQAVASLLGMLMHFSVSAQAVPYLVNNRRPKRLFSTYPNSPAVTKFISEAVVAHLLKYPIPVICRRSVDAESYAERALDFRVLDPSMESGQLMLEMALACVRRVQHQHSSQSKTAQRLTRALLEKLCADCLWGIDRNELAVSAVATVFSLLGAEFGIRQLKPAHLLTTDALTHFGGGELPLFNPVHEKLPQFNGVINNPPWGEAIEEEDRKRFRWQFSTIKHWSDTYIAFSELAVRYLQPDGILALILPSQVIATRNASSLRGLFLSRTEMDQIVLLPRSAFADATVRGAVFLCRARPTAPAKVCRVTVYPMENTVNAYGSPCTYAIPSQILRQMNQESWSPLIHPPFNPLAKTLKLEQLATVTSGVRLHRKGDGHPPQTEELIARRPFVLSKPEKGTVPAIRGRDVRKFQLGEVQLFLKFGKWLAWTGKHSSLRWTTRIFVRELCQRDGRVTAAIARDGVVPLHGVLTVIPEAIDVYALVGILNSKVTARYVRRYSSSFTKVDYQKITVSELERLPIPFMAVSPAYRSALALDTPSRQESLLYKQLTATARKLSSSNMLNEALKQRLHQKLDTILLKMYGLEEDEDA